MRIRKRSRKGWFDQECRAAKRHARRLERKYKSCKNTDTKKAWRTSFNHSRRLARRKASSYWKGEIRSASVNSRRVWKNVNLLFGERWSKTKFIFTADQYHEVMDKKTADIQAATESADDPLYVENNTPKWYQLEKVSVDDVLTIINSPPTKQCDSDPLST